MEGTGNPNPWPLAGGVTALALLTIIGGIFFVGMSLQPAAVAAPTSFARFTAPDRSFSCEYPQGWSQRTAESHAVQSTARFRKGGAEILIDSDTASSIMPELGGMVPEVQGGMAPELPNGMPQEVPGGGSVDLSGVPSVDGIPTMEKVEGALEALKKPAVERLHDSNRKTWEILIAGYEEQAAQPFQSSIGDARVSEFSGKGGILGGAVRGFRASIMGRDRAITVVCRCPERNWAALRPAFTRVINSIGPG